MNKKLSCYQVSALLNHYLNNKLTPVLSEYVEYHLDTCPKCREKIGKIKSALNALNDRYTESTSTKEYSDYETIKRLSAYMDNELNHNENIKIKKMAISNSKVRKELENLYKFQKAIHSAYEKTKNDTKFDYSKNVLTKIQDGYEYSTDYFYKIATLFVVLLLSIIGCFIYLNF